MDALTIAPDEARRLIEGWEQDATHGSACEFFRPGMFNIKEGEPLCARCQVPKTVHRAYRALSKAVMRG